MIEPSLITRTERDILQDYERQRRFRLLRAITPAFIAIATIVLIIVAAALILVPVTGLAQRGLLSTLLLLVSIDLFLTAGLLALRAGRLNLATSFIAGISAAGAAASLAIWGTSIGLDLFAMIELTPFSVVIVLAGLVGNRWSIIGATIGMNIATIVLLIVLLPASPVQSVWYQERPLILSVSVVYQWLFGVIMIVIWSTFARTLTEIGTAYERAKQLDSLKDAFISSVNHELRTPLMTMLTYLETLRERPSALPPEQLSAVLDQVCRVGEGLSDLVKSILSARQFDQEAADFTPVAVPVGPVVAAAIQSIATPYAVTGEPDGLQRDLHLHVPDQVEVWGDAIRLQQIVTNLLSNALKYSPSGTPVEVTAEVVTLTTSVDDWVRSQVIPDSTEPELAEKKRNPTKTGRRSIGRAGLPRRGEAVGVLMTQVTVRDYGQGIPPDQAPLLFNRFVRLPRDLASSISGNGLGLYLCRLYVEAMGGRIWVASSGQPGEGSTFHVLLPAVSSTTRPDPEPPAVAISSSAEVLTAPAKSQ
jgi:signal transduction histidine kinase